MKPQIKLPDRDTKRLKLDLTKDLSLYYSYETIVAFWTPKTGLVLSENNFSNTTGRHINEIAEEEGFKAVDRTPRQKFEDKLKEVLKAEG